MFDEDKSAKATQRMWLKLARLIERAALETAARGNSHKAAQDGEIAEACYWQATGQGDFRGLARILGVKE